jgi:phosphoglycerate dehydrogenase-like enzyme
MPTVEVVAFAPFMKDYVARLEHEVSTPIRVRVSPTFREEDVIPLLPDAEIVLTSHWSKRLGQAAPKLRFIQMPGAGWDKIDPAGLQPGVVVANCYEHESAMGEWVMMMCLALSRDLLECDRTIRMGIWRKFNAVGHPLYPDLAGRTMAIIGLGRVGRTVARLAGAFSMRLVGIDAMPIAREVRDSLGLEKVGGVADIDDFLAEADFVVIATPYDASTTGMFDAQRLRKMKQTAFLLNPARAEMCVEGDLYAALRDRVIAGAALDPWWHYPKTDEVVAPSSYPFGELPNVVLTPHVSGATQGMFEARMKIVVANINRFLRGEPVVNVVRELSTPADVATPVGP